MYGFFQFMNNGHISEYDVELELIIKDSLIR